MGMEEAGAATPTIVEDGRASRRGRGNKVYFVSPSQTLNDRLLVLM